ncbi:MAG: 5-(carboxyamino)imidazole ribonucleotide synthase [Heteroscytonema crispum UTEX LB 1556]
MKRIGVIGGGQLAWMMAGAAKKLGVELVVQTPSVNDPAVAIASETVFAPIDDANATNLLAQKSDIITFENEFVNLEALSVLANQGVCFRPRLEALSPLLDKYHQRCYLRDLGIPVPKFFALEEEEWGSGEVGKWGKNTGVIPPSPPPPFSPSQLGFPVVLKARRHGYDGQGTFIIKDFAALQQQLDLLSTKNPLSQGVLLLEEFIPFERELAVIAARSASGDIITYPVVETQQEAQVCRRVIAPANITLEQAGEIEDIAHTLLNSLQAVGVFGIELFLTADGKILVNEIAPRTHNSGHFSLDACLTSQFEQHLRAVCGLPLGNPALHCSRAVMVNLLGYENSQNDYQQKRSAIAQIPQAHLHWYGKTESRPGRKLGHVTVLLSDRNRDSANAIAHTIESIWYPG